MEDSPATKRAKGSRKEKFDEEYDQVAEWDSKQFGCFFDDKIKNEKPSSEVVYKQDGYHMKLHKDTSPPSQQQMNEALPKFTVTSGQPTNLMDDQFFINFLESFRKLAIDAEEAEVKKQAKDFLPSRNTISKRIDIKLNQVEASVVEKLQGLKLTGGGITVDFANKNVDYFAVTAHFIDNTCNCWIKSCSSWLYAAMICHIFVTTDEGSNVSYIGVENHFPYLCHVGATIAKHATGPYKNSSLMLAMKEACEEVELSLHLIENGSNHRLCPENEQALALIKLAKKPFISDYLNLLLPIVKMVLALQFKMDGRHGRSCAGIFHSKIGDLSDEWLTRISGKLNNNVVVCAAFLNSFTHAQLQSVCAEINGWNYEQV
uniref:RNase H type-1 domain-containing protein n=1 Tax=Ditylenchus dipsaci TaxID=166011 RepID=A0A915DJC1_9BILA